MKSIFACFVALIAVASILGCAATNPQIQLEKSQTQYSKPHTSTQLIKGKKVQYGLWYNKAKWKQLDHETLDYKTIEQEAKKANRNLSYVLTHISNEAMSMISEERVPSSYKDTLNFVANQIRTGGGHLISTDTRVVNGNDVLFIKWALTRDSITYVYLNYYFSNKTGITTVATSTTENLLSEHESDMIDLLNGLVDTDSKLQPTKSNDDIEAKLLELKNLKDKGLITQEDFNKKKEQLLKGY